jgi:hypothetical protein
MILNPSNWNLPNPGSIWELGGTKIERLHEGF